MMEYTTIRKRSFRLDKSLVTINGKRLSDYGVFLQMEGASIGGASPQTSFQDVPGRFSVDTTLRDGNGYPAYDRREITLSVGMVGDPTEIDEAMTLIGALNGLTVTVGGLHSKGEFRGVMTVGDWETMEDSLGERRWAGTTLTLNAEPFVYGTPRTVHLNAGDTRFIVEGSAAVLPAYTLTVGTSIDVAVDCVAWFRANYPSKFESAGWDDMSDEQVAEFLLYDDESDFNNNPEWWTAMGNDDPEFKTRYETMLALHHREYAANIQVADMDNFSRYITVPVTLTASAQTLEIDAANRTVKTNGYAASCTLDSSWFPLKPGRCGISSTVPGTLTYTPLYLI